MLTLVVSCRDAEVKEEGFLEYINQLLMTGEVAGLLPKEELDSILNDIRPAFKRECIGGCLSFRLIRMQLLGKCRNYAGRLMEALFCWFTCVVTSAMYGTVRGTGLPG